MPLLQDINTQVKDRISGSSDAVKEAVIAGLAKKETDRRTAALTAAIEKATQIEKDLKKIKPDQVILGLDKSVISEGYSKKLVDDNEKLTKQLKKHSDAIDKALGGDFGDLYNLANDKGGDAAPAPAA